MGLNDSKSKSALPTNTIFINISHNIEGGMGYYKGKGNSRTYHQVQNFSGMVVGLKREWDNGSQADKIKPHFSYIFTFQDGDEAYQIKLAENVTYTTELLNQFLCASVAKPIEVHVGLWDRAAKKVKISLIQNGTLVERQFSEWDNVTQTLVGIPAIKDAAGEYDYKARNTFWFEKYKTILYPKFNGGEEWTEAADQKPTAEETTAPPVNIYEGTIADSKPPQGNSPMVIKLMARIDQLLFKLPTEWKNICSGLAKMLDDSKLTKQEENALVLYANSAYKQRVGSTPEHIFDSNGDVRVVAEKEAITKEFTDDLPF